MQSLKIHVSGFLKRAVCNIRAASTTVTLAEVVLPPEPMQDEYPDEFEDIGEGNLPPPPINQSKRRLGREWEIHYDGKRNRRYYFNTITGESSWKRPKS